MTDKNEISLDLLTVDEIKRGFVSEAPTRSFRCIFCGSVFEKGVVYNDHGILLEAERAVADHVKQSHGNVFSLLLALGKPVTGLSDIQRMVLRLLYSGLSDTECARELGGKSPSTVRNHRYQLRKRRREAKVFLALMELLEDNSVPEQQFVRFHGNLPVHDDRTIVTMEEESEIVEKAFGSSDSMMIVNFPKKQKAKLVVLNRIIRLFEHGKHYTEKDVNTILGATYSDYVTLRRYLIEYGFLARKPDGSDYWRIGS